jgi:Flp pilus assembly protein TadB
MVMTAVAAAVAVWLAMSGLPDPRRLGPTSAAAGVRAGPVVQWLTGRPDAWPLPARAGAGLLVCAVVAFALPEVGPVPAWRWVPAALLGVGVTASLGWIEPPSARRDRELQRSQLPATLDLLAAALAAGCAARVAAAEVAAVSQQPSRAALSAVAAETGVGRSDAEAWRLLASSPRWQEVWGHVARDLARSARDGVPVQDVLRVHASRARQARQAALEKRARAVGVSSVLPLMVCFLPAFMAVGVVPIVLGLALHYL